MSLQYFKSEGEVVVSVHSPLPSPFLYLCILTVKIFPIYLKKMLYHLVWQSEMGLHFKCS